MNDEEKYKTVSSRLYSTEYLISELGGWEKYLESGGRGLPKRLRICLDYANISKGDVVLDVGCGRGEATCYAGMRAARAVGIDYSRDAVALCKETLSNFIKSGILKEGIVEFRQMDATKIEFPSEEFDKILVLDLIEHLNTHQVEMMIRECKRVLKKHGIIVIHTMPNRLFYDITYPIIWLLSPILKHIRVFRKLIDTKPSWRQLGYLPKEPRGEYDQKLHINEFTYFSLKKTIRKNGLRCRINMLFMTQDYGKNRMMDLMCKIIPHLWPLNYFLCVDLIAIARK